MSSWMNYLTGKRSVANSREKARDAIVDLRQMLIMLEKQEDHLNKKIDAELQKARANATTNKRVATAALRQKKIYESDLDKLAGRRLTLETQVNAIESANMNMETMRAMQEGANVLKSIHGNLDINRVDATMDSIREQMELTNEISDAISNPVGMGTEVDEDELKAELEELEQEQLDERLAGATRAPANRLGTLDAAPSLPAAPAKSAEESEIERELRELQAEMAM
ncbi:uncharacterized protein L969DRAFT_96049 [Mixia osmundae IAM 14324]|uniref:Vacuolar-sorting protein SNF7 n=1 Tax=Mixia osmundae (strain CBS 9802 / IAM 14324 / JCM 22182 / KY 12970) TaxID=764103 RepID=G7DS67_MIXOS|nr:uncharacterized protein L969DRAFT_96049 [Mixia osmundae IAM 14324]KEI37520.1 hypothetical protein L969DRAFT_96049 [Mixia osmundae IAM 14324]GAA93427.1 hypothetical protein E5Q_00068 [Mixia osmundae IAM 14324]